jgi:hypothetical protein
VAGKTYHHLSGAGTTQVSPGPIVLHAVSVNTAGTTVTLHDGADASGPVMAVIDASHVGSLIYDAQIVTGLVAVVVGGEDGGRHRLPGEPVGCVLRGPTGSCQGDPP